MLNSTVMDDIRYRLGLLMSDSITVSPYEGHTGMGASYGDDVSETWKLMPTSEAIVDAKGQDVVASLDGMGPHDTAVKVGDKITWGDRSYEAITVTPKQQLSMVSHVRAYFKELSVE